MHKVVLSSNFARRRACALIQRAPEGYVASIAEPTRTNAQNDKMWVLLSQIAVAKPGGRKLEPRKWKSLFMDALETELNDAAFGSQWEPGLDGEGAVNLGHRSSKLSKAQMGELISFIEAWGTQHGVQWIEELKDVA